MRHQPSHLSKFYFKRFNYLLLIIGIVLICLGYICMIVDKEPYGFGILGITIGPILLILGLITELFAILYVYNPKSSPLQPLNK